ncbi:OLC1v1029039C1 [Oldenlandia corymbosa var. corymbosa]|uniref:OLC1v1029039C1 n=1 Tax=Oldenlandia corymbosa var. corymbosa TaxID=529605 RepID=A0AAV1CGA0_OLDCO|nr:OLC1v1029039C1 [Oldenlandia corymbosa var. corymbosa]
MATSSAYVNALFPVNSSVQKPLVSCKSNHVIKASLSSSIKPYLKELPRIPNSVVQDVPKLLKEASIKLVDTIVDLTTEFTDQNILPSQSNFAPVEEIGEAISVTAIEGCIPDDFPEGVYIRNGPNPPFGSLRSSKSMLGITNEMWVEGEGMVHSLHFKKDETGVWITTYNNKYIQTDTLKLEMERNKPAFLPSTEGDSPAVIAATLFNMLRFGRANKQLSNTSVFEQGGRYYSSAENHMPHEIDIVTLKTLGNWDMVSRAWNRPFTSHPKKAVGTGELVTVGIDAVKPYFVLGVISADGEKLVHKVDLKYDRCSVCHEIGITQRYNVILDFPLTLDISRLMRGGPIFKYDSNGFARIGVMPRYGDADSVKWFEVEPCSVFHLVNCYEDGHEVVVIGCKARATIIPGPDFGRNKYQWFSRGFKPLNLVNENEENSHDGSLFTRVHEWRLNMITGEVKAMNLTGDDFSMDFPFINEGFTGVKNKYGYTQVIDSTASSTAGISKYGGLAKLHLDEREARVPYGKQTSVEVEYHKLPENTFCTGAAFVPKFGGLEEDDGWIISFVHNEVTNASQAYIVDAKKFSSEAVAKIDIPKRVPYGFHGAFMALNSKKATKD